MQADTSADAHWSPAVPIVPESGRYLNPGQSSRALKVIISQTATEWYSSILHRSSSLLRIWSAKLNFPHALSGEKLWTILASLRPFYR